MNAFLKADIRSEKGSRNCKKLRQEGVVPAVLYGKGEDVKYLSVQGVDIKNYFEKIKEKSLKLEIAGDSLEVSIAEVQRHPISRDVLHIDFLRN